jgi:hypothetical protein
MYKETHCSPLGDLPTAGREKEGDLRRCKCLNYDSNDYTKKLPLGEGGRGD